MKIYNVIHSNLFCKASINPLTNQVYKPSPLIIINNKKLWEVKDIFTTKSHQGKFQYEVKQICWDEDREWYDVTRFENSIDIAKDFHSCYSEKPISKIPAIQKNKRKRN